MRRAWGRLVEELASYGYWAAGILAILSASLVAAQFFVSEYRAVQCLGGGVLAGVFSLSLLVVSRFAREQQEEVRPLFSRWLKALLLVSVAYALAGAMFYVAWRLFITGEVVWGHLAVIVVLTVLYAPKMKTEDERNFYD